MSVRHSGGEAAGQAGGLVEHRANYFCATSLNIAAAATGVEPAPALGPEAFEIAQWARSRPPPRPSSRWRAARSGGGALAALVRDQDLTAAWRDKNKAWSRHLSKPERTGPTAIDVLRKQMADTEARLAAHARLEKEFPDYAALASPEAARYRRRPKVARRRRSARLLPQRRQGEHCFRADPRGLRLEAIPLGADALSEKVAAFRHGLDVDNSFEVNRTVRSRPRLRALLACSARSRPWSRTSGICWSCRPARSPRCRSICW